MLTNLAGEEFIRIFYNSPAPMLIIGIDAPLYTMLDVNAAYLTSTHTTKADLIGKSVFGVFPANPTDNVSKNIERTVYSFEQAIKKQSPHTMYNYRYDIPVPGTGEFEERYWTTTNTPVLNDFGEVIYFIHSPVNVTELYKLGERERAGLEALKNQRQQLYSTFMQAPVGIAIFKGKDYVVDLINPPLCELYGKSKEELMGKPIFDVLTNAKGIGFEGMLDNVRLTGIPFKGAGLPAPLVRNGILETVYLNFVFEPFREANGEITGVIAVATEVTELVNAKNQTQEAEVRTRLAVDAVGLGTFDLDLSTGSMITSTLFANIFGFKEPVARQEYIAVFHKDDLEKRQAAHTEALQTGNLHYEARVIWKDDSVHWVRVEGKVVYSGEGTGIRILGTLLDITRERKAQEEQRKLISLVDNCVDLMSILELNGTNSYINKAGRNLLGFISEEEVSKVPVKQLHRPEDFEMVEKEIVPELMAKGKWSGTMNVQRLQTGEVFPVYNNCFRIDDPASGEPIAIGAVMRDMRPELAAKKALADSEQLLRNITAATPTTLWMANEDGLITYINETWLSWTGRTYNESIGSGWLHAIHPDDREEIQRKLPGGIKDKARFEAEFRLLHVDGTIHWCVATGQARYRADGSFYGIIGACIDITDQKLLQQQKDDFIGIASHELKTPVTSIKGYAQVLEKILLKKGDVKEAMMMGRMDTQINRLTSLISDLLDVTKISSGKLQFNDAYFDYKVLLTELIEDVQRTTEKHQLDTKLEHTGLVYGDKERITQVVINLITNAIKYSPDANKILISTYIENKEVILSVQDFGIGIPNDKLEKVFEQFYRVSGNVQHTFPGMGLGLYISSEIVKREGGRIWALSTEGKGSTFCFALPIRNETTTNKSA